MTQMTETHSLLSASNGREWSVLPAHPFGFSNPIPFLGSYQDSQILSRLNVQNPSQMMTLNSWPKHVPRLRSSTSISNAHRTMNLYRFVMMLGTMVFLGEIQPNFNVKDLIDSATGQWDREKLFDHFAYRTRMEIAAASAKVVFKGCIGLEGKQVPKIYG